MDSAYNEPVTYNPGMSRFVIEHLPRASATYRVVALEFDQAKTWLHKSEFASLVRTTELITAIETAMGVTLKQTDVAMSLHPGDEALLITLSFGVLLAWAEGYIVPLEEDWRLSLIVVESPHHPWPALMGREEELAWDSLTEPIPDTARQQR